MKTTYTRTLFHQDLTTATFELFHTEKAKWDETELNEETVESLTGVKSWTIIEGGEEAEDIEQFYIDPENADECHEYLILNFADGSMRAYRNSHVVMFIM